MVQQQTAPRRSRVVLASAWIATLAVAASVGWALRDDAGPNGDLAAAWSALADLAAKAAPVALGAIIGAVGALIVAVVNRNEARSARFHASGIDLATNVIVAADRHARELRAEVSRLFECVEGSASRDSVPRTGSTEPVRSAYLSLGLLDKELGTMGEAVYKRLIALDALTEPFRLDPSPIEYERFSNEAFERAIKEYFGAMDAFRDAWRQRQP